MSFLTRLSLANRGLVALIAIVITGFGLFTIPSLKQQLFPSIEFPAAFVGASLPGASPEIIQDQVTEPIENAVKGVDGIESVTSTTSEGSATITVLFVYGTDLDQAVNQLTTAVNRIQPGSVYPPFLPGQRLDLATAVDAYTAGSAYVNGLDDTGVLRVGAYADLAVLDRDPFAAPVEEIAATTVVQTYVDGVRVHDAG